MLFITKKNLQPLNRVWWLGSHQGISIKVYNAYSLPFIQKYYKHSIYFPSFHHLPRLIILLLSKKVVRTSILKLQIENYLQEKKLQMIQIHCLQEKEMEICEERFHFLVPNGQFHCLVALARFHCLVALVRFHYLVTNGRRKKNTFSPLPTFPPTNFT